MPELAALGLAVAGGILRVSPALLWAAVGDCLTQRGGHFNLGLEGIVACGAVAAVLGASWTGSPWLGLPCAAGVGGALAVVFALCCRLRQVNELAVGIALLVGGVALARFVGEGLAAAPTPLLPVLAVGPWRLSPLLPAGLALAVLLAWLFATTRAGLLVTAAGDRDADTSLQLVGVRPARVRLVATAVGGMCGGIGGACLSLFYPGGWSDQLATGVGISALTLAFIGRARPLVTAALAVGFAIVAALGPALQVAFGTGSYHFINALPYIAALVVLALVARDRWAR